MRVRHLFYSNGNKTNEVLYRKVAIVDLLVAADAGDAGDTAQITT